MPVLFAWREPDYVAGMNFLGRSSPALRPSAASGDDESLTERVSMPRSPRARLEGYAGALNKRRIGRLKKRVDAYRASEPICRPLSGWLRAKSFDFHNQTSFKRSVNKLTSMPCSSKPSK